MTVMPDATLATMIREVLAEELARIRSEKKGAGGSAVNAARVREEQVTLAGDGDLQAFVRRILTMADNPEERRALLAGEVVFRLDGRAGGGTGAPAPGGQAAGGPAERIERGLISERQVDRLPAETIVLQLGKEVRMTPLARDRLRRRGIRIERMN